MKTDSLNKNTEQIEKEVRERVKKLFEDNKIDVFIGFSEGSIPLRTTPCFIKKSEEVEKLVWNFFCSNNLSVYLPRFFSTKNQKPKTENRIGIIAKGCDSRSIIGLIKEHQVLRKNLYIIGIVCDGIIDIKKMQNSYLEIVEAKEKDNVIVLVDENKKETELRKEDLLADVCLNCQYKKSSIYDILIEGKRSNDITQKRYNVSIDEFEKKPIQERWKYFEEQVSKCIRCYACRQACPNCYCKECFAEATKPKWIGITTNISDIMFYQIGRIFHQAGRCVDCGACVRACPMNIDLRMFTYKLVKDVKEFFGYEAGISLDEIPSLVTFKLDDKQEFITEP